MSPGNVQIYIRLQMIQIGEVNLSLLTLILVSPHQLKGTVKEK